MINTSFSNHSNTFSTTTSKETTMNNTARHSAAIFFSSLENMIKSIRIPGIDPKNLESNLNRLRNQELNLIITGPTGCGKSSTINALFNTDSGNMEEVAKVGVGVDPETMDIAKYRIGNLVIWDTPGLGDGKEADLRHAKRIIDKLYERDHNGKLLIDLVLVILDGSSRDLGTSYELINKVIIPNLGENKEQRILVAINQADLAMKGRHWDYENNRPDPVLVQFLEDKCESVRRRIHEGTGLDIMPIYYSAGCKEEGQMQERPYNLAKLMYFILEHVPAEKRIVATLNANQDTKMWSDNDSPEYGKKILKKAADGVTVGMGAAALGGTIGSIFGPVGTAIGAGLGAIFGFCCGFFG